MTTTTTTTTTTGKTVLLAAVQDSPVAFDLDASIAKLQSLTAKAAKQARQQHALEGADHDDAHAAAAAASPPVVVVFPEAFLSCYPRGYDFGSKVGARAQEGRTWFRRYHQSSVPVSDVDGVHMRAIRKAASDNSVTLVVGVIERCNVTPTGPLPATYGSSNPGGAATLYCTALTIGPDGTLLASHRKLMPTGSERLVWGQGDGAGVRVADTPAGRVGAAICWENYMPLLRYALYARGVEIWAAPTADMRDSWQASMRHIAFEGRCFLVSVCQYNVRSDFPDDYPAFEKESPDSVISRGGSVIVDPLGNVLAGPLYDQRGILTATVNMDTLLEARMDFDPCGHYARNDIFSLQMDERSKPAASATAS